MAISIALIILLGLCGDYLFRQMKLPGLVGMLLVGIFIGPYVLNLMAPGMMTVSGDFRKIALIVILLRAGFELRRDTLNRVGKAALTMSAVPAIFEIAGVMLVAPRLLGMTYLEAAILGSILAAVSPAVVVPLMIDFMDRGRGAKKGIPTLLLGASSIDDVFVIVLFTVFLGMYGGGEVNLWVKLAQIPISIVLGIIAGLIPGYFLYRLFTKYDWQPPKRTIVIMGMAIFLTWLEQVLENWVPIASLLGVMAIGFVILEKSEAIAHIISQKLKKLWVFAELLLFVLVGAQVNIQVAWKAGLAGILVILVGLLFRSVGTYISLFGTNLSAKEKLFCVVAYIPKATVQAAIGAVPLAAGVASGEVILAVAVLSILLTAPIGAIGIKILGERILDSGERSSYMFKELMESMGLPRVGERVRNKESDTVWKVIEEKETWIEAHRIRPAKGRRQCDRPLLSRCDTGKKTRAMGKAPGKPWPVATARWILPLTVTGRSFTTGKANQR
jgi:NhaP-type Na+/H+ or K+/H+ antiporter